MEKEQSMKHVTALRLPGNFIDFLDRKAEEKGLNRSDIIRELMMEGLDNKEHEYKTNLQENFELV